MSPELIERIFEPFFTTKEPGMGTGLGLSVVHGIIKNHDGIIAVSSEPSKGTKFRIYLPPAPSAVAAAHVDQDDVVRGHGEHILYLDDEASLVLLTKRRLERLGYKVSGHTNAEQAVAAFRAEPASFDAVVTDLTMPGLTGHEIARRLREIRPNIQILMTSGYVRKEDAERAAKHGVNELLTKPCSISELGRALARASDRARADRMAQSFESIPIDVGLSMEARR